MDEIGTIAAPETAVVETPTPETPESPTPETPIPETGAEPTEVGGEDEPLPGEPEDTSIETDGRTLDKQTSENIAALKKLAKTVTDPAQQKILAEAAKNLADKHFRFKAYEKEFPTVQEARQAKATLESLGGEEGITELQTEMQDWRTEADQFAKGDRALLEKLNKANPESTVTMLGHGIDILTEGGNIEALDKVILKPMVERLKQAGFHSSVLKAAEFVKEGKGQEAYDQLGLIGDWLTKVAKTAGEVSTKKAPDPREAALTEREQKIQQQEKENYDRSIGTEVAKSNNLALDKHLRPFFKTVGLDNDGKREFTQAVQSKIWAAMKADKVFQRQAHAIKAKGDPARTASFIAAKFDELSAGIFNRHKNTMYPNLVKSAATNGKTVPAANGKQPVKPAPQAADGATKAIKVATPAPNEVDWAKDPGDKLWARGLFYKPNDTKLYSYF
jgi:hypothetical protein